MTQKQFNQACRKYLFEYKDIMRHSHPYEIKGIFHSELLMICTLLGELGAEKLIESGRARGQSTEILGRYCLRNGIEFDSIEISEKDKEFAEEKCKGLRVNLLYGDSFELMPKLVKGRTLILIDGPKSAGMWKLFQQMKGIEGVLGVAMHDCHWESSNRKNLERECKPYLSSDDLNFVTLFQHLDEECWKVNPWGAYQHGSYISGEVRDVHSSMSYSATICFAEKR